MAGRARSARRGAGLRGSLRNRLALIFFAITAVAIAVLYLFVAPGLRSRLVGARLTSLATAARQYSGQVEATIGPGSRSPKQVVENRLDAAALESGYRVTLMLATRTPAGVELSQVADSPKPGTAAPLPPGVALAAARSGQPRTGTAHTRSGTVAEAAYPVRFQGRTGDVLVYSSPVSDVFNSVDVVRRQILIAGGI
ncbi:MAG TPA: hypothetical protein VE983_08355, partial [Solirubrobacteraceae bacterium]|nr:hypothetical protein [Solirubrobacteraceae bacterium]